MAYRVAVTSSDGVHIDEHFGHSSDIIIVQIEETGEFQLIDKRNMEEEINQLSRNKPQESGCQQDSCSNSGGCRRGGFGKHDTEYIKKVAEVLVDCKYLLTEKIGNKPQAVLYSLGITALEAPEDIAAAISKLHLYYLKGKK